jgi:hypothetical protein
MKPTAVKEYAALDWAGPFLGIPTGCKSERTDFS